MTLTSLAPTRRQRAVLALAAFGPWFGLMAGLVSVLAPDDVLTRHASLRAFTDAMVGWFPSLVEQARLHRWPEVALLTYSMVLVVVWPSMLVMVFAYRYFLRLAIAEGRGGLRRMTSYEHWLFLGFFVIAVGGVFAHVFVPATVGIGGGTLRVSRGFLAFMHTIVVWLASICVVGQYVSTLCFIRYRLPRRGTR